MAKSFLNPHQKADFLNAHIPHRLTLLRTFRDRKPGGWHQMDDLYRCAKDSALISIRLFMNALGIKGVVDTLSKDFYLEAFVSLRGDDVQFDQLDGHLVDPKSLSAGDQRLLAGVYVRADKELAHLTLTYNEEFNQETALIAAITLVERLIKEYLYDKVNRPLPSIDSGPYPLQPYGELWTGEQLETGMK